MTDEAVERLAQLANGRTLDEVYAHGVEALYSLRADLRTVVDHIAESKAP